MCNLSQTWDHRLAPTLQHLISKWPVIHLRNWPAVCVQCGPCIEKPSTSLQPSDPLWLPWDCSKTPRGVQQAHLQVVPAAPGLRLRPLLHTCLTYFRLERVLPGGRIRDLYLAVLGAPSPCCTLIFSVPNILSRWLSRHFLPSPSWDSS